jgi:hypothetical protein
MCRPLARECCSINTRQRRAWPARLRSSTSAKELRGRDTSPRCSRPRGPRRRRVRHEWPHLVRLGASEALAAHRGSEEDAADDERQRAEPRRSRAHLLKQASRCSGLAERSEWRSERVRCRSTGCRSAGTSTWWSLGSFPWMTRRGYSSDRCLATLWRSSREPIDSRVIVGRRVSSLLTWLLDPRGPRGSS